LVPEHVRGSCSKRAIVPGVFGRPGRRCDAANSTKPFVGAPAELLKIGTARHGDVSLSPAGRSCDTCHAQEDSYNATFKRPWPHFVASVKTKTGLDRITAEGMVQFCMISAMGGRPLPWDSETLASLTEFVLARHRKVVDKK
jgi:hypothetical protein